MTCDGYHICPDCGAQWGCGDPYCQRKVYAPSGTHPCDQVPDPDRDHDEKANGDFDSPYDDGDQDPDIGDH